MVFQKGNKLWKLADHKGQKAWNKDLTKSKSPSLKKQGKSLKIHWAKHGHPKGMANKKHSEKTKLNMSKSRKGSKNANWKGGLTAIKRRIKQTPEYYQWRKAVLERDKEICQTCDTPNSKEAHHILSIKEYPLLIFDVNNGLTQCVDCHKKIHLKGVISSIAHA